MEGGSGWESQVGRRQAHEGTRCRYIITRAGGRNRADTSESGGARRHTVGPDIRTGRRAEAGGADLGEDVSDEDEFKEDLIAHEWLEVDALVDQVQVALWGQGATTARAVRSKWAVGFSARVVSNMARCSRRGRIPWCCGAGRMRCRERPSLHKANALPHSTVGV